MRKLMKYIKRLLWIKPCSGPPDASAAKKLIRKSYEAYTVDDYLAKLGIDTKGEIVGGQNK